MDSELEWEGGQPRSHGPPFYAFPTITTAQFSSGEQGLPTHTQEGLPIKVSSPHPSNMCFLLESCSLSGVIKPSQAAETGLSVTKFVPVAHKEP